MLNYEEISQLIEKGELEQAQKELDDNPSEDAQWYYLQSWILYNLGWYLSSKYCLEQACSLEPDNQLYREKLVGLLKQGEIEPETNDSDTEQTNKAKKGSKRSKRYSKPPKGKIKDDICNGLCEGCASGGCECCCQCGCEGLLSGC